MNVIAQLQHSYLSIIEALLLSLSLVLILSWISLHLAARIGLVDQPRSAPHKQHARSTPIAGGIAIFATIAICNAVFSNLSNQNIRLMLISALPIFIFGLWDDFSNLSPWMKLLGQLISALALIMGGISVRIFESPEFFIQGDPVILLYLDYLLTIFWVVGITNAFNLIDSMDGLAVGLGGIAAAFFMLITLESNQIIFALYSAILLGSCAGIYLLNSPPAILFLGDSGSQTLGFLFAALAIVYIPQNAHQASSWFVPVLILGLPIFDATLVIISRLRRNRPVFLAARDHTYHRLIALGLGSVRAVLFMQILSLVLSSLAILLLREPPIVANLAFLLVFLIGGISIIFLDNKKFWTMLEKK